MNFMKEATEWSSTGPALIKVCAACFGIAGGVLFHCSPAAMLPYFLIIILLTATAGMVLWVQKTRRKHS